MRSIVAAIPQGGAVRDVDGDAIAVLDCAILPMEWCCGFRTLTSTAR